MPVIFQWWRLVSNLYLKSNLIDYPSIRGTRSKTALALVKYFSNAVVDLKRCVGEHLNCSVINKKKTAIKRNFILAIDRMKLEWLST